MRVYLANVTEYEPVVTFHLHGEFFSLFRTGTGDAYEYTDTVTLSPGRARILEIEFHHRGLFMFHAHQSQLADNGLWAGSRCSTATSRVASARLHRPVPDEFGDCTPCLGQIGAKPC